MSSLEKSELLLKIGLKIKALRIANNLTQVDLVGKMQGEIDTTNISRIETGRTNPTIHTLFRIAEALGVTISELVEIEENE